MLTPQNVYERLAELFGGADEERLAPFCEDACAFLGPRVKSTADENDSRLVSCAAKIAYARYTAAASLEDAGVTAMTAGDISLSLRSEKAEARCEKMISSALADAADLISDTSFMFGAV